MNSTRGAIFGALVLLSGCSTAPLSFVNDNQVYFRTKINRYPVQIVSVDGGAPGQSPLLSVSPGPHVFRIAAPPTVRNALPIEKVYTLNIAPCTRYYIAADRAGKLTRDWDLVVEETESVGGCDPTEELRKANIAAADVAPGKATGISVVPSGEGPM